MVRESLIHTFVLLTAVVLLGVDSCDTQPADPMPEPGQRCAMAADQAATFLGRVRTLPVEVVIDSEFTKEQHAEVVAAIEQWNTFSEHALGIRFFELKSEMKKSFLRETVGREYCGEAQQRIPGLIIVRVDSGRRWEKALGEEKSPARGLTTRCKFVRDGQQSEQQIAINTIDIDPPMFHGVALHELGHAMGLGHSCAPKKRDAGTHHRACEDLKHTDPYYEAVMYPELRATDRKNRLRSNDMERAYCLYQSKALKN